MPFGIDDALIWGPMLGAALGGVASKKDPLKGALLGAGVGLGGAGLLGAGGAAAVPGMAGSLGGGIGASTAPGLSAAGGMTGLTGTLPMSPSLAATATGSASQLAAAPSFFDKTMAYAKPLGQAANAASQVNSMFSQNEQPVQASPLMQNMPNNQLGQLVQNMGQEQQNQQQLAQQKREMRHKMIRGLV